MLKRCHVFMRTTKQVIPFTIKLWFIEKLNGKKKPVGVIHQGGAIIVIPRHIFVPLKRYGHPEIEPRLFRTRFIKRS